MVTKPKGSKNPKTRRKLKLIRHANQRMSRRFTQSGGDHEIQFILEEKDPRQVIDFEDIGSLIPDTAYILQMVVKKEDGSTKTVCTIEFTFNEVGELNMLHCFTNKLEPYKIKSYLIIHKLVQVLKARGVQTVLLMPLAENDRFIKLYNFYKTMGFVCIDGSRHFDEFQTMNNMERLKFISEMKMGSDAMLKSITDKNNLNRANIIKLFQTCMYMAGSVDDILSITKDKINEWELGFDESKKYK